MKFLTFFLTLFISSSLFSQQYADSVLFSLLGGKGNVSTNLDAILGEPEFPNFNSNTSVSLGGGFILIDLGTYAINGIGADLKIYEVGESYGYGTEPFYVLGNQNNSNTNWQYLGSYPGDICLIDFDSLSVDSIRYISIHDAIPTNSMDSYIWPGADIDAVEILNYVPTSINNSIDNKKIDFILSQNYPNPFNPVTSIYYSIKKSSNVKINIYNSLGHNIKTILNEYQTPGKYLIQWNGRNESENLVSSGTYFYQLIVDDKVLSKRMILLK